MYNLILFMLSFSCNFSVPNSDVIINKNDTIDYYGIEFAHISYKVTGTREGTEELYFIEPGKKETSIRKTTTTSVFYSVKTIQKENLQKIIFNDECYAIDLDKKTGVKTDCKKSESENPRIKEPIRHLNKSDFEKKGAKNIGKETILGRECEIWKDKEKMIWFWEGIPLKIMYGNKYKRKNLIEAINIDLETPIDSNMFKIPPLIEVFDNVDYLKKED